MAKTLKQRLVPIMGAAAIMAGMLFSALPAHAVELTIVPLCARNQGKEAPSLNCVMQTFANVGQLILGITGSFALLMFVYGGFTMLASGGSQEKVSKGKTILTNAVIGIVIILTSGLLIQYGLGQLKLKDPTIGAKCTPGAGNAPPTADPNGPGIYMQLATGKADCVTSCKSQVASTHGCAPPLPQTGNCFYTEDCKGADNTGLCCPK